jgi:hypothetical protein
MVLNESRSRGPHDPNLSIKIPIHKNKSVILSEASEFVAPAFGRNNQFRRESNGPAFPRQSGLPAANSRFLVPALPILQQDKWRGTSATQRWS